MGNLSAIPERQNCTLNLEDDEIYQDFKFLGGMTQLEGPTFLMQSVITNQTDEEFKTLKIDSNIEHLNKNLEKVNKEIAELKRMLLN